jgi:hypothetical protein
MPARYHPISDSLWADAKLEGATFETKGFFAFLCSNVRQRPSGIYRVSDHQLSADTGLAVRRVKMYVAELEKRGLVVRDGLWLIVLGYFGRQPHQDRLLSGVQDDVTRCDSVPILTAFGKRYPRYRSFLPGDLQATIPPPSPDGQVTPQRTPLPMQSRATQSNATQSSSEQALTREQQDGSQVSRGSDSTNGQRAHEPTAAEVEAQRAVILASLPATDIGTSLGETLLRAQVAHFRVHGAWPDAATGHDVKPTGREVTLGPVTNHRYREIIRGRRS